MLDLRFRAHNTHIESPSAFHERDPNLNELRKLPIVYRYPVLESMPAGKPGIYSMTGGRQIGKTTVLKQWMADLLESGVAPERITYMTGELIDDHHMLVRLLSNLLEDSLSGLQYILLDEITYISDWVRGVKFLVDAGVLRTSVLMLTGSDSVLIREARASLPGRRGPSDFVDYHLYPLTLLECAELNGVEVPGEIRRGEKGELRSASLPADFVDGLSGLFEEYLIHGGYLTAINDLQIHGEIRAATLSTYGDWIRGDVLKRGKQERFLAEILRGVLKRYGTQITWNNLCKDMSIEHPATVADYVDLLERMDVLFVQRALREDRLSPAPKKARKVYVSDPFIFHAMRHWLDPGGDPYRNQIAPLLADPEWKAKVVEACAVTHFRRFFPTCYIKADGEVDIACIENRRFWPVEIKWTGQIRPKDLKQIRKYHNARILSSIVGQDTIHGIVNEYLPLALLKLGRSPCTASQ